MSQFWYDEETSNRLGEEVLRLLSSSLDMKAVCISSPSVFLSCAKKSKCLANENSKTTWLEKIINYNTEQ